jgi:hypothetical protein
MMRWGSKRSSLLSPTAFERGVAAGLMMAGATAVARHAVHGGKRGLSQALRRRRAVSPISLTACLASVLPDAALHVVKWSRRSVARQLYVRLSHDRSANSGVTLSATASRLSMHMHCAVRTVQSMPLL